MLLQLLITNVINYYSLHNYSNFTYIVLYMVHTFQPPGSSKREFYNEASISWRQHNGAHWREDFEFRSLLKPEN